VDNASFQFVFFGIATAVISNFGRSTAWRSTVLFVASIVFLSFLAHNLFAYVPLLAFVLLGYGGRMVLERGWSKFMVACVLLVLVFYLWLKKYAFLPDQFFLSSPYLTLGLSYVFFRVMHLLIETGDKAGSRHIGLGAYMLYTLNFTTLVSGPIQRYDEFSRDQFADQPIPLGPRVIGEQLERIVRGFFKVNVLAMLFDIVRVDALSQLLQPLPPTLRFYAAFRLFIAYPLFLYANFSGYIDIVIALARLMRLRLPENFDRPFAASSVLEFWNRWHMTLSNWFKAYVYNPLVFAMMRRVSSLALQPLLGVAGFFATFFLVGIWHGRTSEFVMFGLLTGGGISINKLWQLELTRILGRKGYKKLANKTLYVDLGRGLNFSWFAFTLLWFWADWTHIGRIFSSLGGAQWAEVWCVVWLSASVVLASWETLRTALLSFRTADGPVLTSRYARVVYASALGLAAVVMAVLLNQAAPGIVYKAF
jgi:D-alanyl-lipoteichoic acid acyltransferase DltB (MBOAT superfamily)